MAGPLYIFFQHLYGARLNLSRFSLSILECVGPPMLAYWVCPHGSIMVYSAAVVVAAAAGVSFCSVPNGVARTCDDEMVTFLKEAKVMDYTPD